ncbi:MAG: hypothetical protein JEZ11_18220 [Desulfobacterales bacterium]|nr:hypothetical protein [Desulfobacterales bacterium]
MIARKKEFYGGIGMIVAFFVVLAVMFMPVFKGHNALNYLDSLYNSISKGSAYYVPDVAKTTEGFRGKTVSVSLALDTDAQARQTASLFMAAGALVNNTGSNLKVSGDLATILAGCLKDADDMYHNRGVALSDRYGYPERQALFNWWTALKLMDKDLKAQKRFDAAKVISMVNSKAVETAYNYYRIEPQKIGDRLGTVIFSLIFYVLYTLWYGFGILFLFEGWGLRLEH